MEVFFTYLLKSSLLLALFWACSQFFLQRDTFFQQHRLFLLLGICTALLFPFVIITKVVYVEPVSITLPFEGVNAVAPAMPENYIDWWTVLLVTYITGASCLFLHFCIQLLSLRRLISKSSRFKKDGFRFVETSEKISPFSFFNYIVYNPSLYTSQELETILAHEKIHSRQKHSVDIILVHLLRIFQWMNPFVWGYKKLMSQNLEYIADNKVGHTNSNKKEYQYLLLRQSAAPMPVSALGNPFFNSLIKKRIVMLNKNKSNKGNLLKFSIIIPLLAIFLLTLNTETVAQTITIESNYDNDNDAEAEEVKITFTTATFSLTIDKDSSDEELDAEIAQFKNDGIDLKFSSIQRNNKGEIIGISSTFKGPQGSTGAYSASGSGPIKAFNFYVKFDQEKTVEQIGYSVDTPDTHKVHLKQHFDTHEKHLKATGKLNKKAKKHLDAHKKAVLKVQDKEEESTIEINGKAFNKTSVSVTSSQGDDDTEINISGAVSMDTDEVQETTPLYVVNGKVTKKEDIASIPTYQIVSINVLKGKNASKKYGDKGKDGVVEITIDTDRTEADSKKSIQIEDVVKIRNAGGKKPMYVVDGKVVEGDFDAEKLDPDTIKSVFILKGKNAKRKYGKKGKHGVVVIETKK
ncbi:M56 family metallopeptidase [Spongiimicrobium salis]|uniref:M56 family metallopeptidase n=1 Tax=Spongiimicrobium salis TaxID=1667022 RepID=UPI00374D6705